MGLELGLALELGLRSKVRVRVRVRVSVRDRVTPAPVARRIYGGGEPYTNPGRP